MLVLIRYIYKFTNFRWNLKLLFGASLRKEETFCNTSRVPRVKHIKSKTIKFFVLNLQFVAERQFQVRRLISFNLL